MSSTLLFIGGFGGLEVLLILIIPIVIWFWSLIDCLKSDFKNYDKVVWVLLILLLPMIGAILYFILGRSQKV